MKGLKRYLARVPEIVWLGALGGALGLGLAEAERRFGWPDHLVGRALGLLELVLLIVVIVCAVALWRAQRKEEDWDDEGWD